MGRPYLLLDSVRIGSSTLQATYRHWRTIDTLSGEKLWCLVELQIGSECSKQTNLFAHLSNVSSTHHARTGTFRMVPDAFGDNNPPYFGEIVRDEQARELTMTCSNFIGQPPLVYKEKIPEQEWVLLDETDSVAGYACLKAQTRFRGRIWTAWYTPEIPISLGPWKLSGLPGLILKATDSQDCYSFECILLRKEDQPMYLYQHEQLPVTRMQYLKYERRYHRDPVYIISEGGQGKLVLIDKETESSSEIESWAIPYNPIERE